MECNTGNKAVIHNPFTVQQQMYLKTIQSEFIYAFLSEDYSAGLYCKMFIKSSTQTWGQTTIAQESWKIIKLSVMKHHKSQGKIAHTF